MYTIYPGPAEEMIAFARRAVDHFAANPNHWTYTDEAEPEEGKWVALRWGVVRPPECPCAVLVFEVGTDPVLYGDMDHDKARRDKERQQILARTERL